MPNRNHRCGCSFTDYEDHDELLGLEERGVPAVVGLLERAATFADTGECPATVVPPMDWPQFGAEHSWRDAPAVYRLLQMIDESWRSASTEYALPVVSTRPVRLGQRLRFRAADAFLSAAGAVAALRGEPLPA